MILLMVGTNEVNQEEVERGRGLTSMLDTNEVKQKDLGGWWVMDFQSDIQDFPEGSFGMPPQVISP